MHTTIVHIENLHLNHHNKMVFMGLNWTINQGENWLLDGASGSGKTTLLKAIAGQIKTTGALEIHPKTNPSNPSILYVESWYQFKNLEGQANFYYQQRYTSLAKKETHTIYSELLRYGEENQLDPQPLDQLLEALGLADLKEAQLLQLSSGEHKKMQLVKALWQKPEVLLLDQPYTGLDVSSRKNLNLLLDELVKTGVQIIMVSTERELPTAINRYAKLENGLLTVLDVIPATAVSPMVKKELPAFLTETSLSNNSTLVKLRNVNIHYGDKQVLKNIDWEIKAGEKWLLQGHNGSGKSTLLSLINGDHPQSYANDIELFGRKRGTGESIWDIKKEIGWISPEFHWYFDPSSTVWQSIASGFSDSSGLYEELTYSKQEKVNELLAFFGLEAFKNTLLNKLSVGQQRIALLARTVVKNPTLLILDEPCQGLDLLQTEYFNHLIDELGKTGQSLIYVAHTAAQLPSCLTHQLLLRQGQVVENLKSIQTETTLVQ